MGNLLNDVGVLLFGCWILWVLVKELRDKSWKDEMTPLDQQRMRAKVFFWPSVAFMWTLTGIAGLLVVFEAFRVGLTLWRMM